MSMRQSNRTKAFWENKAKAQLESSQLERWKSEGRIDRILEHYRVINHKSTNELADDINRSRALINRWESGEVPDTLIALRDICDALNITPNQLMGYE